MQISKNSEGYFTSSDRLRKDSHRYNSRTDISCECSGSSLWIVFLLERTLRSFCVYLTSSHAGLHLGVRHLSLFARISPPSPGPCEHCRRCESKTKWYPPSFLTVNFCPFLTIFRNEPLLMSFVYGKWSNTEDGEALGTRLITISRVMSNNSIPVGKPGDKQVQKHITKMEECFWCWPEKSFFRSQYLDCWSWILCKVS